MRRKPSAGQTLTGYVAASVLLNVELDGLTARFLPQNKAAEGGPGSGPHPGTGVANKGSKAPSEKQIDSAIRDYKTTGYHKINGALRDPELVANDKDGAKYVAKPVSAIDAAMQPLGMEATTVYRGSTNFGGSVEPGSVLTDKGFFSVSLGREHSEVFSDTGDPKNPGYLMKFDLPAGHVGISIGAKYGRDEQEIILPRGMKMQVDKITEDVDHYGEPVKIVHCHIVK